MLLPSLSFILWLSACLAVAERDTLCDDAFPVTCANSPPTDYRCGSNGLWALQNGCFLCVDALTCLAIDARAPIPQEAKPRPSIRWQAQAQQPSNEDFARWATANNALVTPAKVYHWLFAIPVSLVTLSLFLVLRARNPLWVEEQETQVTTVNDTIGIEMNGGHSWIDHFKEMQLLLSKAKQHDNYKAMKPTGFLTR